MNSSLTVIVSLSDPQDLFLGINSAIYLENGRQTYIGDLQGALELMEVDHQPCSENPSSQCDSEAGRPEGNGDVIVQMCDITLRYGETEVLRGLDWTIRTDERWALLGSNGAGKSALISLLVGHNPQCYVNNVSVLGRRRGSGESIWDIKRHIGFMASELFRIIPSHRSCLDTVMSGYQQVPEFVGVPNSSQIEGALRMLELVGLRKQAYQPLGTLANGSQRLVLLARAVVHKPAIVVLDEPCENLDRAHRNRFDSCLDSIASELNLPFVLATHRLKELPSCLTHVMVLEAGKVAQIWTPNCQSSLLYCETN
jgi:molybdate transport system ATP-binding protein